MATTITKLFPTGVLQSAVEFDEYSTSVLPSGQQVYTTPGTYSWTAPAGVTSVSVVAVGGGGGGGRHNLVGGSAGGAGGGLGWKNNIPVTPGQTYTVVVGASGEFGDFVPGSGRPGPGDDSYFIDISTVAGLGGGGGIYGTPPVGGSYVGDGGGHGGRGGYLYSGGAGAGGGGAGGYNGNGGDGSGSGDGLNPVTNSGGGGGGGSGSTVGGKGGGVGLSRTDIDGIGGLQTPTGAGHDGTAGSNGSGQIYGGGGSGAYVGYATPGGSGAVRIIWGTGRSFPSTNTADVVSSEGPTGGASGNPLIRVTPTNIYAREFDEVSLSTSTAERRLSTGVYQVSGYFDEYSMTVGQQAFTTPGTYSWTAPAGVTSVNVVAIGGGSGGYRSSGGAGGGLGWKNNIPVTPGQAYTVVVGAGGQEGGYFDSTITPGGNSYFSTSTIVCGRGGSESREGTNGNPIFPTAGGTYVGDGGGNGGTGGVHTFLDQARAGGGGAGGYSGDGGKGFSWPDYVPGRNYATFGSGGGGGGGSGTPSFSTNDPGSAGGGTGIYGQGSDGQAWTVDSGINIGGLRYGGGGSGGGDGSSSGGGLYGGGAGSINGKTGGGGAVRIIWGSGRAFPSTNTNDV